MTPLPPLPSAATAGAAGAALATSAGMVTTTGALTAGGLVVAAGTSAVITTAAVTATVSATNASMNADGNLAGSLDDVGKTALKDTTSKESIKNIVISATIAAAASWVIVSTYGKPNLGSGSYDNSRVGVNTVSKNGKVYEEMIGNPGVADTTKEITGTNKFLYDTKVLSRYDNNPIFKSLNVFPSAESGAAGHDKLMEIIGAGGTTKAITAPPYLIMNLCAASPSLCAVSISNPINNSVDHDK